MNKMTSISDSNALKLVKIGNSTGVILPKDMLERLGVEQGDSLTVIATEEGSITLKPNDPEFEKQMAAARDVMKRRKKALRELAK